MYTVQALEQESGEGVEDEGKNSCRLCKEWLIKT